MTICEFTCLPEFQKMKLIWSNSIIVSSFEEEQYRVDLYKLFDFYVEEKVHLRFNVRKMYRMYMHDQRPVRHLQNSRPGNVASRQMSEPVPYYSGY